MKALLATLAGIAALAATLTLTSCDSATAADSPGSIVGKTCVIQFRRDALGAAATLPIPPMSGSINGADTAVSAVFKRAIENWVIVERNGKEVWISRDSILLMEF